MAKPTAKNIVQNNGGIDLKIRITNAVNSDAKTRKISPNSPAVAYIKPISNPIIQVNKSGLIYLISIFTLYS